MTAIDNRWTSEAFQMISSFHENQRITDLASSRRLVMKTNDNHNKSVRFALHQNETYHSDYVGKKLARSIWYTKEELQSIKANNRLFAKEAKMGKLSSQEEEGNNEDTCHGLEYLNILDGNRRSQIRQNAFDAVMIEQQNQYFVGNYHPSSIADVYRLNGAESSQQDAYARAAGILL